MEVMVMVVAEMDVSCRGPKMKVDTEPSGDFATNSVGCKYDLNIEIGNVYL